PGARAHASRARAARSEAPRDSGQALPSRDPTERSRGFLARSPERRRTPATREAREWTEDAASPSPIGEQEDSRPGDDARLACRSHRLVSAGEGSDQKDDGARGKGWWNAEASAAQASRRRLRTARVDLGQREAEDGRRHAPADPRRRIPERALRGHEEPIR